MDETRVQALIRELDEAVPREGAIVRLDQYGGGPDESSVSANQLGYLRLGIEFLRGAFVPPIRASHPSLIQVQLDYLIDEDSDVGFDSFERREDLTRGIVPPQQMSWRGQLVGFLLFASGWLVVACAVVGAVTMARWVWRWLAA